MVNFSTPDIAYGIVLGALSFLTYILYLTSFSGDNTSVSVTIYRMNMIPGILLAVIFLGEAVDPRRGSAIISCILSVLLLGSWKFGRLKDDRHLLLSIGACISGGVLNVVNKAAIVQGGNSFNLLFIRFTLVFVLTGLFIIFRKAWTIDRKTVKYALFSGILLMLAIYFILEAFRSGDVALVLPVTQLSFTLVVFASRAIFKEVISVRKVIGKLQAVSSDLLMK